MPRWRPNLFLTTHFSFIVVFIRALPCRFIRLEQPTHAFSCIALLIVHCVPINIRCYLNRSVAQGVAHRIQWYALRDEYRDTAMPQVVEAYCPRQAFQRERRLEVSDEVARLDWCASIRNES